MTLIRRFFSGPSLMQAVLAAARHHEVDPENLAYEVIDKKHGFLKTPRGVVIEVDPERPTGATQQAPEAPAEAAPERPVEPAPGHEPETPRHRLEEMTEPVAPEAPELAPETSEVAPSDAAAPEAPALDPPMAEAVVDEAPSEAPPASDAWGVERLPWDAPAAQAPETDPSSADREPATERPAVSQLVDAEQATREPAPLASPEPESPADESPADESPVDEAPDAAAPEAGASEAKWWDAAPAEPAAEVKAPPALHDESAAGDSAAAEAASGPAVSSPGEEAAELGDDLRQAVEQAVDELVYLAGLRVQVASATEVDDGLAVELEGPDSRRVVAHGGRALLAIQHLLPRLLFNKLGRATHCRLDCDGFHAARGERLERLARKAAERVRAGGRSWLLEPMAPDERRLVHLALAEEPDVETESVGEGYLKRVRVAQI
jgi:spoIIIJ-associated protein